VVDVKCCRLGDVADLIRGVSYKPSDLLSQGDSDSLPLLRATNIGGRVLELSDFVYVPAEFVRPDQLLKKFDIVIAMASGSKAAVGRLAQLRQNWTGGTGSFCAVIRAKDRLVDPEYLGYVTLSPEFRNRIETYAQGTAIMNLSHNDLMGFTLELPVLSDQRAIAGVLGALDDKIEANRRLIRLLEETGRAELARNLSGANGDAWEFAWPEQTLGEVLDLIETGDRPKGGVAGISDGIPSIGAESIVSPGVFDYSKTKYVSVEYFNAMKRGHLHSGDVLLYKDGGTPGNFIPKVSMFQDGFPFEVAAINSHVYRLRTRPPYSQGFLYYWLSSQRLLDEMWLRGTGAAIPSLNSTNVKGLPFPIIPEERLSAVIVVVDALLSKIHQAAREARHLEQLRDAMLPELLSGRLRVRDTEKVVEGAV